MFNIKLKAQKLLKILHITNILFQKITNVHIQNNNIKLTDRPN